MLNQVESETMILRQTAAQRQAQHANPYSAGTDFIRQNLTSRDVRF